MNDSLGVGPNWPEGLDCDVHAIPWTDRPSEEATSIIINSDVSYINRTIVVINFSRRNDSVTYFHFRYTSLFNIIRPTRVAVYTA